MPFEQRAIWPVADWAMQSYGRRMIRSLLISLAFMIARALAAVGRLIWAMIRPGLRFISAVLLVAATVALTIDVTRWQTANDGPMFKSLAAHIRTAAPATLDNVGLAVSNALHPLVWDPVLTTILAVPAWMLLLLLAIAIGYATRERRQVNIFIN